MLKPAKDVDKFLQTGIVSLMECVERITIEAGKRSGKPCIRGLRITVYDVFGWYAEGMSTEEILTDYPELTREDLIACFRYAADRESRLLNA